MPDTAADRPVGAAASVRPGTAPVPTRPAGGPKGDRGPGRLPRLSRRAQLAMLVGVVLLVLGAVPIYAGIRALVHDPVFDSLDSLNVPAWAAMEPEDEVSGSRWCLVDCRLRERITRSERGWEETAQVYEQALVADGWRPWRVQMCPGQPVEGRYSCWRRDELTLDLWVRSRLCATDPEATPSSELVDETTPDAEDAQSGDAPAECAGSLVTLKVRNAIDDDRNRPEPSIDPSLVGETPDPVFTEDPLAPSPS